MTQESGDMAELSGLAAIVTGGGSGIGLRELAIPGHLRDVLAAGGDRA
jgi:hypothetical protein